MKGQQVKQKIGGNTENKLMWGLLILCINLAPVFGQWESDQRLTFDANASWVCQNYAWSVGVSGDTVHVVWFDNRDTPGYQSKIYYKRSLNGGGTWGPDTRLTDDPALSAHPSVAVSGANVHVVWQDKQDNRNWNDNRNPRGWPEIYYKRSQDGGTTWGPDNRLTNDPAISKVACVAVSGSNVHVTWHDFRDGNYGIYYKRSQDGGTTWGPDNRLTDPPAQAQYASIAVSGSNVHVTWQDNRDGGNYEVYYKRSTDGGTTWGPDIRFTDQPATASIHPSVAVSSSDIHVVWQDYPAANNEIYYKRSQDGGTTWGSNIRLIYDPAGSIAPSIAASGLDIHVAYIDNRDGDQEIYYIHSPDGGTTWGPDTRLTNSYGRSLSPHIAASGSRIHVVWRDERDGNTEIYYKRNYPGQPIISHRPLMLTFNYNFALLAGSSEKHVIRHSAHAIGEKLSTIIHESGSDEFIPIFVMLAKQLNPGYLIARAKPMTKSERRDFVINESKALAHDSQREILSFLRNSEGEGKVTDIVSLWAANTVCLKAKPEIISKLAQRQDVWQIGYSTPLQIIGVEEVEEPTYEKVEFIPDNGREICWGIARINADHVWPLGYTGAGIIVGSMDSGVNYNHTDLADHMWDGGAAYPNHGWDFVNNDNNPMDNHGHGTACAGIVAGDGTSGSNTGVAPDAQIMALKIYPGTEVEMGQAIQFALENNADLLSCSIGWSNPSSGIKDWCRGQSNTLYAAGLVWCNAAGNGSGGGGHYPVPKDIVAPACCPGPWYAPNGGNGAVIAVGATDINDDIVNFSSYGPTAWETGTYSDYPYPPGLMKPDVSAPGFNCKSLGHTNNTGYVDGINGTSFAQPHYAGTVALLLSIEPLLLPQEIDSLIQNTAFDIEIAGRDSLSGAGRIDALAAVANTGGMKCAQLWVINQVGADPGVLEVSDITKAQNQPWLLAVSPAHFYCNAGDSHDVRVTVDTTGQGLTWGQTYYDTLLIWSNASNAHLVKCE
jgi:hypothetical protein